jgi:hypothetical protein
MERTATVITLVERACPSRDSDATHAPPGTRAAKLNVGSEEKCLRELGPTRLASDRSERYRCRRQFVRYPYRDWSQPKYHGISL